MDGKQLDGRDLRCAMAKYGRPDTDRRGPDRRSGYGYDRRRRSALHSFFPSLPWSTAPWSTAPRSRSRKPGHVIPAEVVRLC